MTRETRNHVIWLCLLWIVFSAVGEVLVEAAIDRWPMIGSEEAEVTGEAVFFLLRATAPVFVLVTLILVYTIVRFRVPQDDAAPAKAQYASGWAFVTGWVGMSVVLNVFFIIHPGITGLEELWNKARAAAAADPLEIQVTAKQWQWDYKYSQHDINTVNDLVVPNGKPIRFTLVSADVIHSFWVPAWGVKKAVIPGETRTLFITPTEETSSREEPTARTQCAQICGIGHARMRGGVRVVSNEAFADWLKEQKGEHSEMTMPGMQGHDEKPGEQGHNEMPGMPGMQEHDEKPGEQGHDESSQNGSMPGMTMPGGSMSGDTKPGDSMPQMPNMDHNQMNMPGGADKQ